jgi:hypothetical protein
VADWYSWIVNSQAKSRVPSANGSPTARASS